MKGTIRQRGATFTAYWHAKDPATGRWRQRSKGGFKGVRAAQAYLTARISEVNAGTFVETRDKTLTIAAFMREHWLPAQRTEAGRGGRKRRETTLAMYESIAESWLIPHCGGTRLVDVTPRSVETVLATLRTSGSRAGKPLGDRSVQAAHGVLKASLEYAVKARFILRNPAADVGRPGVAERSMTSWTAEEARAFLTAARSDRLFAGWVLLVGRGLRRGELAGLRWADVDLEAGTLQITTTRVVVGTKTVTSTPKTNAGRRLISLDPTLVGILREHRRAQLEDRLAWGEGWMETGYLFVREDGVPLPPQSISQRFERLCDQHGVRRIPLHGLRHTAASLALADGTPVKLVSEMLGHSDPRITLSIYQHVTPAMHAEAGARLTDQLLGRTE